MKGRFMMVRRALITAIAGFLILLHVVGLYDTHIRGALFDHPALTNVQSLLSLLIIISLTLVIMAKRMGLVAMWISITALILTQYWAHFGFVDADFTAGRSLLSYLRGFMIPTLITVLFLFPFKVKR
ncbi:hypothetical protein [uncultured Maritalea sp.]|uniref:hypothetical protein n=1 Tax=uncultured Maritalea sp. TaxID=757249 RepID=UPI0026384D7F|nr:hypothetical protein [uncultured Maritalea sp.]